MSLIVGNPEVVVHVSSIKIPIGAMLESPNGYDFGAIIEVIGLSMEVETAKPGYRIDGDSIADHIAVTLVRSMTPEEANKFALRLKAIIEALIDDGVPEDLGPEVDGDDDETCR